MLYVILQINVYSKEILFNVKKYIFQYGAVSLSSILKYDIFDFWKTLLFFLTAIFDQAKHNSATIKNILEMFIFL